MRLEGYSSLSTTDFGDGRELTFQTDMNLHKRI